MNRYNFPYRLASGDFVVTVKTMAAGKTAVAELKGTIDPERIRQRFIQYLREQGYRVTRERLEVLKAVLQRTDHFTADELYAEMQQRHIRIARATVYATLELLTECGILVKHHFERSARFELADKLPGHDHLICTQCGHIVEFQEKLLLDIQEQVCKTLGFVPLNHSLQIFAVCASPQQCTHKTTTSEQSES